MSVKRLLKSIALGVKWKAKKSTKERIMNHFAMSWAESVKGAYALKVNPTINQ